MSKRLSNPLQINALKSRFVRLNPLISIDLIDWDAALDHTVTMDENLETFRAQYPQYTWDEKEDPYRFQVVQDLRERASDYGLNVISDGELRRLRRADAQNRRPRIVIAQKKTLTDKPKPEPSWDSGVTKQIYSDMTELLITCLAINGHGKSSMMRNLVESAEDVIFKVFDVSQVWFHSSPMKHRIRVRQEHLYGFVPNLEDCVYELGLLTESERRWFIAHIIGEDYALRYAAVEAEGLGIIDQIKPIIYIIEEANTVFKSASLNKEDDAGSVLRDWVSVGRNYGLRGILIATGSAGELATRVRERSSLLLGRLLGRRDVTAVRQRAGKNVVERTKRLGRFEWIYWNGVASDKFKSQPYASENVPVDYVIEEPEPEPELDVQPVEDLGSWEAWRDEYYEGNKKGKQPGSSWWKYLLAFVAGVLLPVLWLVSILGF